jgi:polysaccharide chain length determinant protein (PEP-CTERM system associated)
MQPNIAPKKSPIALLRALKRRKLFLLLPVLVLLPAISFYALRMPPRFRARALVGAEAAASGRLPFSRPDTALLTAQDQLRAVRETMLNTRELERVIHEFNLYDLAPNRANGIAIEAMRSRIQIQMEGAESFFVGFEGSTPEQAMQVANRLAGLFIERKSDLRGQRVEQEDTFLDAEVARLRDQLKEQDDQLKGYKLSGAPALPERLTANLKQIETLQQQIQSKTDQITEGEARRAALADEVKALESQGILDVEPPSKSTTEVSLDQLLLKLNELKAKYTPEHPEIGRLQKEIQDLEAIRTPAPVVRRQPSPVQVRYMGLQAELRSMGPRLESYRREREALRAEMQTYDRRINASPGVETALIERMRDAALTRTRYETLYAKQQETKLSHRAEKTGDGFAYRIIEPAQAPAAPYSQPPSRIILAGLLGSLGIGLLAAFLAERLNPSFETAEELERFTHLPVLSSVPGIPGGGRRPSHRESKARVGELSTAEQRRLHQDHRLTTLSDPQSVGAQQYAILALKIQQWMAETGGKTLMITSGSGAEGKSLTALNLSLALAAAIEGRVLLVDSDLRLPQVHERLGLSGEHGFSDLLAPDGGETAPYISTIGALHVLPGGSNRLNPVGLLGSTRAREILARLRNEYQLVVLDSPPIVPIADSHILAGLCDGIVLVVRARQTRPELLLRSIESLKAARVIGVVLNDVELAATPYAYAYRYYQRHYLGRS